MLIGYNISYYFILIIKFLKCNDGVKEDYEFWFKMIWIPKNQIVEEHTNKVIEKELDVKIGCPIRR